MEQIVEYLDEQEIDTVNGEINADQAPVMATITTVTTTTATTIIF